MTAAPFGVKRHRNLQSVNRHDEPLFVSFRMNPFPNMILLLPMGDTYLHWFIQKVEKNMGVKELKALFLQGENRMISIRGTNLMFLLLVYGHFYRIL